MTPLDTALRLAGRDIPAFFCRDNKAPATPHGFKDATTDPSALHALWRRYPGPLVGVPTGPATFDALDIDPRHGGDSWLAANAVRLPITRVHQTRSGGQHILLRHRPGTRNSESKISNGVDVRASGGYIVWWPDFGGSVIRNAPLAPWPDWLAALLAPTPSAPRTATPAQTLTDEAHANRIVERVLTRLRCAPPGQRHYALRAAAFTLGGLLNDGGFSESQAERHLMAAVDAAGGPEIKEANARATIRWGLTRGAGAPLQIGGRPHG